MSEVKMSINHSMGESNLHSRRVPILVLSLFFSFSYIVSSFSPSLIPLTSAPVLCSTVSHLDVYIVSASSFVWLRTNVVVNLGAHRGLPD